MTVRLVDSPSDFLDATRDLRGADPVRTNVIGTIAQGVVDGRRYERETWFVVEDASGTVVGAAVWTPPHKLVVAPMSDDDARDVGRAAAAIGPSVPGVVGHERTAWAAAEGVGAPARQEFLERILVLGDYVAPAAVPGRARLAGPDDTELVVAWLDQFKADAGLAVLDSRQAERQSRGRLWLWELDGDPVAMAGHAPVISTPSSSVVRVGPVYTPAARRRRGFGAAVTAAVTETLMPHADTVMLFTDAANPTSNALYERLGYVHADDVVELEFEAG
jgi:predicted GNAT family acetyltransferase